MTIRTRFAPSPTGYLHVGGIRTALFAYLVARQAGGQFILRLEDTDKKREVEGSAEHLVESLQALGLNFDEGPGVDGDHGPYRQSDRLERYQHYAQLLIGEGRAYADPYTPQQLQDFRDEAKSNKKAFLFRDYRPDNPPAWDGSMPLRFRSEPRSYTFTDEVMGEITTGPEVIDDFILIKSDGYPTYNFAHIVDDLEMEISHVIRGQEFISSMPNYLNLYEALGYNMAPIAPHEGSLRASGEGGDAMNSLHEAVAELQGVEQDDELTSSSHEGSPRASGEGGDAMNSLHGEPGGRALPIRGKPLLPVFAHLPHIMNEQGNKKLGKRDGAKDVLDYLREGYLPQTLTSFIATMGWNDGTEQEVFTMDQLIEKFSLERVQRSGARFDEKRLLWMNGQFIRELSLDDLYQRVADFWPASADDADEHFKRSVLALAQDRLKTLRDLGTLTDYFFTEPTPDLDLIAGNKQLRRLSSAEQTELLKAALTALTGIDDWNPESIQVSLNELLESTGQKPGVLFSLVRIATTWAPFSPELNSTLALIGKATVLDRLQGSIDILNSQ